MCRIKLADVAKYYFWDFDGVIKDSVEVKANAFEQLFSSFGKDIADKVRGHHEANGGISRYEKLPLYLEWAGQSPTQVLVDEYSLRFSKLAKQNVIDSDWVPGVLHFIECHSTTRNFFLVTATPQSEIEEILKSLQIQHYFSNIIGAPRKKDDAIYQILSEYSISSNEAVMIGDSSSDYEAATANNVLFILRRTRLNRKLQERLRCPMIDDFRNE